MKPRITRQVSVDGVMQGPGGPTEAAAMAHMESLWPRLAELPLVVESCEYDRLHAVLAHEFQRVTTHVRLVGAGADGLGEDVSVHVEDGTSLHETQPALPLAGEWTLAGFCDHLATLDPWPKPPEWEAARRYRNWAFESAALDLALRQAGRALHDVLGLEPRPVRFVNSLGLGDGALDRARAPAARPLAGRALQARRGGDLVAGARRRGRGDRRGRHDRLQGPVRLRGRRIRRRWARCTTACSRRSRTRTWRIRTTCPRSRGGSAITSTRVSYDAPIHSAEDIGATPLPARVVNVKPSRIGSLRALFEVYARCARERRPMYGGGMGELGVGRGQIELLAALFHADAPNDVAPSAYNEDDPAGGLPASPLAPRPDAIGFRWAA